MKNTLLLFVALVPFIANSQKILVPYRVGNAWGVSDTLGHIVIKPAYDAVLFGPENRNLNGAALPQGFLLVKKNGKYGIVQQKEILKPVYSKLYCINKMYFFAYSSTDDASEAEVFTLEGKPMMAPQYHSLKDIWLYSRDETKPTHIVFLFRDSMQRQGLYCYNVLQPARSAILVKDYWSLVQVSKRNRQLTIRATKTVGGEKEYLLIGYSEKKKDITLLDKNSNGHFTSDADNESAPYADDDMLSRPTINPESQDGYSKPPVYLVTETGTFRMTGNEVYMDIETRYNMKTEEREKYTTQIVLPAGASDIRIVNYKSYGTFQHELKFADTIRQMKNYILYQLNGKTGFISLNKPSVAVYDTVMGISMNEKPTGSIIRFWVGVKDSQNTMHYGVTDADGGIVVPPVYRKLLYNGNFFTTNRKYGGGKWMVQQNSKYGLLTADNHFLLQPVYDTILQLSPYSNSAKFTLLKKDGLYGTYFLENEGVYDTQLPPVLIPPFTNYRISEIFFLPRTKTEYKNFFTLLQLQNEQGEVIGYTNKNGTPFFAEEKQKR